jgi:hypothetical protein
LDNLEYNTIVGYACCNSKSELDLVTNI